MQFYTYLYVDPVSGVPVYVGKGSNKRAFHHLRASSNQRLNRLIKKRLLDGVVMKPVVHFEVDEVAAHEMEKFWIALFGRADLQTGSLFNLTDGGEGTSGVVPWNKGKQLSAAHKASLSASKKGVPQPDRRKPMLPKEPLAQRLGVRVRTPSGVFESFASAAAHHNVNKETVRKRVAKGLLGWERCGIDPTP